MKTSDFSFLFLAREEIERKRGSKVQWQGYYSGEQEPSSAVTELQVALWQLRQPVQRAPYISKQGYASLRSLRPFNCK